MGQQRENYGNKVFGLYPTAITTTLLTIVDGDEEVNVFRATLLDLAAKVGALQWQQGRTSDPYGMDAKAAELHPSIHLTSTLGVAKYGPCPYVKIDINFALPGDAAALHRDVRTEPSSMPQITTALTPPGTTGGNLVAYC